MKKPLSIAHRGFSGIYPENTLVSFAKAIEINPDGMECDIHLSADGKVIVIHDDSLDRTTDKTGKIAELDSAIIRSADAGVKKDPQFQGEKVPFFEELLELTKGTIFLCVELKAKGTPKPAVDLIRKFGMEDQVIIFSFDSNLIMQVKEIAPVIPTLQLSWLDPKQSETLDMAMISRKVLNARANCLGINREIMTPELARWLHSRGIFTGCYTVNEEPEMKRLINCDVDAIISDYPDRLLRVLADVQ